MKRYTTVKQTDNILRALTVVTFYTFTQRNNISETLNIIFFLNVHSDGSSEDIKRVGVRVVYSSREQS